MTPHRIVLVTGLSGSGKSTAIRALEDAGYFCIDNLPVVLLPKLLDLISHGAGEEMPRLALVVDARESRFLDSTPAALEEVRKAGHLVEVVFLDCSDETLLRRFSETRRRHPLSPDGSVAEGIAQERLVGAVEEDHLDEVAGLAHLLQRGGGRIEEAALAGIDHQRQARHLLAGAVRDEVEQFR